MLHCQDVEADCSDILIINFSLLRYRLITDSHSVHELRLSVIVFFIVHILTTIPSRKHS